MWSGFSSTSLWRRRRADGGDHALADPGDDGLLAGAAHQPVDVGAHGHARDGDELDAVLGHGGDAGRLDHLGDHRHLHRLQHVAPGQVDGRGPLEGHGMLALSAEIRAFTTSHHVAAGQVVRLQVVDGDVQPGLHRADPRRDHRAGRHAAQAHADEREEPHVRPRGPGGDPEWEGDEIQYKAQGNQCQHEQYDGAEHTYFKSDHWLTPVRWGGAS